MALPAIQAAAHTHFTAIKAKMDAAHAAHTESPELDALHEALNALMTEAADLLELDMVAGRGDGHKGGPEDPNPDPEGP